MGLVLTAFRCVADVTAIGRHAGTGRHAASHGVRACPDRIRCVADVMTIGRHAGTGRHAGLSRCQSPVWGLDLSPSEGGGGGHG